MPDEHDDQHPELASVSKEEWRALYETALRVALGITQSKARADQAVQRTFEALLTTRRWKQGGKPLRTHVIGILKSLLHHEHASKASERAAQAHEGFYREVAGLQQASPEEITLAHAETADGESAAKRELEELEASVASHPVAPGVLRSRANGTHKSADIARALNIPVDQVYRANELLRDHLKKLRNTKEKK